MCVHKSGRFVIVSNRGHQSIAVFRVKTKGSKRGELQNIGCIHTRGDTPRHFQFDNSGQYLLVANQDTDSIAIFTFNLSNGELKYSGNEYRVPSPNFVCCCPTHSEDDIDVDVFHQNQIYSSIEASSLQGDDVSPNSSDSEDSTVPAWTGRSSEAIVKAQLADARKEIESLKKLLATRERD